MVSLSSTILLPTKVEHLWAGSQLGSRLLRLVGACSSWIQCAISHDNFGKYLKKKKKKEFHVFDVVRCLAGYR